MGTVMRLAWRNIGRQRRRTFLLVLVVAYASATTIFLFGFQQGQSASLLANQARYLKAPANITMAGYLNDPDPENAFASSELLTQVTNVALSVNGVANAAPRLELFGLIRSAYRSQNTLVRGVDPQLEPLVSLSPSAITEGRMLQNPGEIVMGKGFAERLDVRLGERVALDASAVAGPQAKGLILVGVIDSGITGVDEMSALIHLADARDLTGVLTATSVALDIKRGQEEGVTADINAALQAANLAEVQAHSLSELLGELATALRNRQSVFLIIVLIFALFAAVAVTSTVLVSVLERSREFGMMAAIGFPPPRLAGMVITESVLTSLIGWLIGLLIGYTLTLTMGTYNVLGTLFSRVSSGFANFGLGSELYTLSRPSYALLAFATVGFAALLALVIPARRVVAMNVVEAMRHE